MLKELFTSIVEFAQSANTDATIVELPNNHVLLSTPDGKTKEIELENPDRDDRFSDVESFIDAVNFHSNDFTAVFICGTGVVAVLDDAERRRHRLTLSLVRSEEYEALATLPHTFTQARLRRFLKRYFALDSVLLKGISKVDFARTGTGKRTMEHGKETLGRSVEQTVQGADGLPESTTITVPVYANAGLRKKFSVELRVDIDVENEEFCLMPGPNELSHLAEQGRHNVLETLRAGLETENVYLGLDGGSYEADPESDEE